MKPSRFWSIIVKASLNSWICALLNKANTFPVGFFCKAKHKHWVNSVNCKRTSIDQLNEWMKFYTCIVIACCCPTEVQCCWYHEPITQSVYIIWHLIKYSFLSINAASASLPNSGEKGWLTWSRACYVYTSMVIKDAYSCFGYFATNYFLMDTHRLTNLRSWPTHITNIGSLQVFIFT